jgi:ubiquitin carboxyl-terminal hydrolase 25/28
VLPSVNPSDPNEFATPGRRQFLEDVVFELSERIAGGPDKNSVVAPGRYVYQPVPAAKDIEATLGCFGYTKVGSRTVINLEESEHPHYAGLGALEDFADELIVFAYERQRECDSRNSPYYLECLQGIAAGRNSDELQEKSVIAVSMGEHTLSEIEDAYKFLTVDPNTDFGDEHIIGLYRSRIDAAPRQKEEARQCLLIIGQARQSEMILAVANDKAMSVDEALEYLSVTHDTPSDSIEAAAVVLVSLWSRIKCS